MRECLKLGSTCSGYYWVDGDPGYWQAVNGKVTEVSDKVYVEGMGAGFYYCKVEIKTDEGLKIAYVLQSSQKCSCEKGSMSYFGAEVGNLPKLRDCKIDGGCSGKVLIA